MKVESLEGEIWKDIIGYEDRYEISNYGRVKKLCKRRKIRGKDIKRMEFLLKSADTRNTGWLSVCLRNGKHITIHSVKSLVVSNFIFNSQLTATEINRIVHKDGDKSNLNVNNLCLKSEEELIEDTWNDLYKILKPLCDEKERMLSYSEIIEQPKCQQLIYTTLKTDLVTVSNRFGFKYDKASYYKRKYGTIDDLVQHIKDKYNGIIPLEDEIIDDKGLTYWINTCGGIKKLRKYMNQPAINIFIALDNEWYDSTYDAKFANFLYINNITFEYNKRISTSSKRKYKYDFKITGLLAVNK